METSTDLDDTDKVVDDKNHSWSLVRKPLRRFSTGDRKDSRLHLEKDAYISKRSLSLHAPKRRTTPVRSLDDSDLTSKADSQDEIRLNPWTTYRRAPQSVKPSVLKRRPPLKPKPKPRPRPILDVSVISNLMPVGQLVTFRRVMILPENDNDSADKGEHTHINPVYEHDTNPPNKPQPTSLNDDDQTSDMQTDIDRQISSDTKSTTHASAAKQNSLKQLFGIQHKDIKPRAIENQQDQFKAESEMKVPIVPIKTVNVKNHINGVVSKIRNSRRRVDSQNEQLADKVECAPVDSESQTVNDDVDRMSDDSYLYCRIITKYPKSSFLLTFAGHFFIAMATVGLLLSGYDLFPTDFQTLPMSDWKVPWYRRDLAWRFRDDYENRYVRKWFIEAQHKWYRSKDYGRANIVLYYDTGEGNIFEKDNLLKMKEIEDRIFNIEEYRQYCVQTTAMICQKPTSILRLFDGTFSLLDPSFFDPGFNSIAKVLHTANTNNYTKSKFAFFLSKDSVISPTLAFSPVTRTVIPMGYPLQLGEHSDQMEDKMESFLVKYFKPIIEETKQNTPIFKVVYWSYLLFRHDIVIQIMYDSMFAGGSAMFIFMFIVYHTKSLWISTLSVFSILTSFLASNMFYRVVLDYKYFGFFHVIAFFIILGIGADDLFVFIDVWKSTGFKEYRNLAHRLSDAYRKSVLSMFFTSLTTAVAFFANAFSPLLAPKSFGIFAGILVIVNYISVIVFFPTVIIIQHLYFENWKWPCLKFSFTNCQPVCNKNTAVSETLTQGNCDNSVVKQELQKEESLFEDNTSRSSTGHVYNVVGKLNTGFTADDNDEYGFFHMQRNTSQAELITPREHYNELFSFPSSPSETLPVNWGSSIEGFLTPRSSHGTPSFTPAKHNNGHLTSETTDIPRKSSETSSITPLKNNEVMPIPTASKTSIVLNAINNFNDDTVVTSNEVTVVTNERETDIDSTLKDKCHVVSNETKKQKALVIFFRDYYFRFVTHWLMRWMILVILLAVVGFFGFCITKLETENEQVQLYRKSHNYGRALDLDFHYFVANEADRNVVLHIVWGLKARDMSVCHFSDSRCQGKERFDEDFDPNTQEAQIALKKFCDRLHSFTADEIEYFSIRRRFVSKVPEIRCFTDELDGYLKEQSEVTGLNLSLPWNYRRMIEFMQSKSDVYNTEKLDKSFNDTLQVPISYWLNDGYTYKDKSVFNNFHSLIGESISHYSTPLKSDMSVFVGNKIRYIGIQVNLTLGTFTSGYPLGKPAMDRWEKFVQAEMKKMPKGLQNGFQLTRTFWHSVSVQKTMADNAILGIVIGILFAFPILIVATQNVIIAFFAIFSMCCSTVCVVGVIPLVGWKLGILESLNMCMVVGLTVDYVVHLAESYHMSSHDDRKSRVRDMLELMGISVFSGACTTLGASLFMVFAQIQFIIRFGIFMFCTIGFSLVYSLGMFTTLMGIMGPNGQTGDIKYLYKRLKASCCGNKQF